jgi:hypothetical protein
LEYIKNNRALFLSATLLVLIVAGVTIHNMMLQKDPDPETGVVYTHYNNFLIFKGSFHHLISHQDLYQEYPQEQYDLFKYTPTFALLMGPIAVFPAKFGLFLWNLLNALVLFVAFWKFPSFSQKQKLLALAFVLIEMITSIQNTQSNALMAGLFILGFVFLEKDKPWTASFLIVLTVFIKVFGIVALAIFIFYPKKIKNALISLFWIVFLGLLPLIVISPAELTGQYRSWLEVLNTDASVYSGLSVISWLHTWFGLEIGKNIIVLAGAVLLLFPLIRITSWKALQFRIFFLSSLLIWMVIFNHMAESPTFIIAVSGVAIWFFGKEKRNWLDISLVILVLIFTVISPTDIFPSSLRKSLVEPYVLKAVPCIFVWMKIQYDLWLLSLPLNPLKGTIEYSPFRG